MAAPAPLPNTSKKQDPVKKCCLTPTYYLGLFLRILHQNRGSASRNGVAEYRIRKDFANCVFCCFLRIKEAGARRCLAVDH